MQRNYEKKQHMKALNLIFCHEISLIFHDIPLYFISNFAESRFQRHLTESFYLSHTLKYHRDIYKTSDRELIERDLPSKATPPHGERVNNFSSLLLVAVAADAITADVDAVALHSFGQN